MLNQKIKRNINIFPQDICFQITNQEFYNWRSQNVIFNSDKIGFRGPFNVFIEQDIAMLSSVLKTPIASKISVDIIKVFVNMRKYI